MPVPITNFAYQNWVIAPSAPLFNAPKPKTFRDQRWTMTLSGIFLPNFVSHNVDYRWASETFSFSPDVMAPIERALALAKTSIPETLAAGFVVEDYAALVTINSIFDQGDVINAGFAADNCYANFGYLDEHPEKTTINNVLSPGDGTTANGEFLVDVGVCDNDAVVYRLGYNITLYGRIAFGE